MKQGESGAEKAVDGREQVLGKRCQRYVHLPVVSQVFPEKSEALPIADMVAESPEFVHQGKGFGEQ